MVCETMANKLSYDYIRGLVDGEGCFSFHTAPGNEAFPRMRIPVFAISMHERDEELINAVRDKLGLKNKVYNHKSSMRDGSMRGRKATLFVRDVGSLKNIIIPFFYNRLIGHKSKQFIIWLERIGNDPSVLDGYRILYRLYKCGWFEKNPKFLE